MPGGFGFGRGSGGSGQSSFTQLTTKDVKALQRNERRPRHRVGHACRRRLRDRDVRRRKLLPESVRRHDAAYEEARKSPVEAGTFITAQEEAQHARGRARPDRGREPVRQRESARPDHQAQRHRLRGRGVLVPKGTNGIQDQDDIAIAPLTTTRISSRASPAASARSSSRRRSRRR